MWPAGSVGGWGQRQESGWLSDVEAAEDRLLGWGEFGALVGAAGVAGELPDVQGGEFFPEAPPGVGGVLVLGDADEEQREPAQQDVGADPVFSPVVHGAEVEVGPQVPPAPFDLEQLLVAGGDVLR